MTRTALFATFLVMMVLAATPAIAQPRSSGAVLGVSPTLVSVSGVAGSAIPSTTVQVRRTGNRVLRWTTTAPTAAWLSVAPTSGNNAATLTLTFATTDLGPGDYSALFFIVSGTQSIQVSVFMTLTVSPTTPPPPPTSVIGPTPTITCPPGSVDVLPGQNVQLIVSSWPSSTTFCLRAGIHPITAPITPRSGDTFVGEYGAILDGAAWSTGDREAAAIRALNQDIDYVTIRNLVIRKMPQKGIEAFHDFSDHWTIEHNEIAENKFGIEFAPYSTIRYNVIHHNISSTPTAFNPADRGGGYICQHCDGSVLDGNEIAYNGQEQKVLLSADVTFTNNFVHHNFRDGIWFDTNYAANAFVVDNRVEDNGRIGIDIEATNGAVVQGNVVRRNKDNGVFVYRSQRVQIHDNVIEDNLGGVEYYISCDSPFVEEDLKDNATVNNTIAVAAAGAWGGAFSFPPDKCSPAVIAPYLNGSKNLTFANNTYRVPNLIDTYWRWGGWKTWVQWQAIPQDANGRIEAR